MPHHVIAGPGRAPTCAPAWFGFLLLAAGALSMSAPAPAAAATVAGSQTFQTLLPGQTKALVFTLTVSSPLQVTLQSVRFTNKTVGAGGTQAQLNAELGQPRLILDNGNGTYQAGADTSVLKQATASGGSLLFSGLGVVVPTLGSVALFVVTDIPSSLGTVRDGDNLDLSIQAASDVTFSLSSATNAFPVDPAGSIAIDGSSAAQFRVTPVAAANILAGTNDNL